MSDDILDIAWNILKEDEQVVSYVDSDIDGLRIKYFTYPETADMQGSWIILEPIINALPSNLSDRTWVTYDFLLHVEVWSRKREDNIKLANRIRDLLWDKLGFKQNDSTDEFDLEIYRDARRYEGQLHRSDLDNL